MPTHILIIDDEPINIKVVRKHLGSAGYHDVVTTTDAADALNVIQRERPDLILLDVMMPGVSGLDILGKIRAGAQTAHTPVLILTAFCDLALKRDALGRGATDFLTKPVDPVELLARVRNALEAKSYADQLQRHATLLECEVVQRRQAEIEARRAKDEAERANRAKSAFLATMSHEIRTRLNGATGMTDLLLRTQLDPQQRRYAQVARASGQALLSLINDILDISKIEAGKLELESTVFDLYELTHGTVEMLMHSAREKGLELQCVIDRRIAPHVCGDPVRLQQILINLTSNAVKFTLRGEVELRAAWVSETDAEVNIRFSVRDTGIGIPRTRLGRLFQSFSQVSSSTSRQFGGTGLGLAISRQLVELMGGQIGVDSTEGQGSTFWFTIRLPKARPPAGPEDVAATTVGQPMERPSKADPIAAGDSRPDSPPDASNLSILLAEDSEINQEVTAGLLAHAGYSCDVVSNGVQAVEAALRQPYDVILMDCQMPEMDGYEATRTIRRLEAEGRVRGALLRRVSIIALTAHALKGDRERCLEAGMDEYVTKPLKLDELLRTIIRVSQSPGRSATSSPARQSAAAPAQTATAPLAFDELLQRCMGNREFALKLITKFEIQATKDIEKLGAAIAAGDASSVARVAHSLKGAAANLSAAPVQTLAARLEAQGRTGDLGEANACLAELRVEWQRLMEHVAGTLDTALDQATGPR